MQCRLKKSESHPKITANRRHIKAAAPFFSPLSCLPPAIHRPPRTDRPPPAARRPSSVVCCPSHAFSEDRFRKVVTGCCFIVLFCLFCLINRPFLLFLRTKQILSVELSQKPQRLPCKNPPQTQSAKTDGRQPHIAGSGLSACRLPTLVSTPAPANLSNRDDDRNRNG